MGVLSLTSIWYLVFLCVCMILFYAVKKQWQWYILLIGSIAFFLLASGIKTILWLFCGITVTYIGARLIQMGENEKKKRIYMILTVVLMVSSLILLKYQNTISVLAPIGISFYTLSALSYVLDVYWKTTKAQTNFLKHALYICYFPQMISGPITRYPQMKEQFFKETTFSYEQIKQGLIRLTWGFFKKCVIADQSAVLVNTIFADTIIYQGWFVFFGSALFVLQLYTDFSGCMDIVLGTSQCFGVTLPENFQSPFRARTLSEFWRLWHITLGTWFKEYLLYPLLKSNPFQRLGQTCKKRFGKKAGKKIPTYLGLLIIWFLIGYWHGGALHYIIGSGLLQWFYMVMGEILEPIFKNAAKKLHINREHFWFICLQRCKVFLLICSAFLFFRAETSYLAAKMLYRMIRPVSEYRFSPTAVLDLGLPMANLISLFLALLLSVWISHKKTKGDVRQWLADQSIVFRWGLYVFVATWVVLIAFYAYGADVSNFIYHQF